MKKLEMELIPKMNFDFFQKPMALKHPKELYTSAAVATSAVSCMTKCLVEKNKNDFHTFETKNE